MEPNWVCIAALLSSFPSRNIWPKIQKECVKIIVLRSCWLKQEQGTLQNVCEDKHFGEQYMSLFYISSHTPLSA